MNLPEIVGNITSWLDNSTIEKMYVLGIIPQLTQLGQSRLYWHSRIETLSKLRVPFDLQVDWHQTYNLLLVELAKTDIWQVSLWNIEDNSTVTGILLALGYKISSMDIYNLASNDNVNILALVLNQSGQHLTTGDGWLVSPLAVAVGEAHYRSVKVIIDYVLENKCILGHDGYVLGLACKQDALTTLRVPILRLLLQEGVMHPSHIDRRVIVACTNAELLQVLVDDGRIKL
ncbi:Hypothetical protein POVR2_LOCUS380 [uncultured virus]|nr:Hypothetical protein POVR2_LOCUS380 [uncultured virus]